MHNSSTSQKYIYHGHPSQLQYPDPIKVSSTSPSPIDLKLKKDDGLPDQLSDLASFSPDEADSMIQSAAGRSPLPSPPRHCSSSFSTLPHLPLLEPHPRPSSPDELLDPTEWDHLSISTRSLPPKNPSHPSADHYDLNHSPESPQADWFYPSCSPTPTYIKLSSTNSSLSNFKSSNFHLQEWQKTLPEPHEEVVPPEATISELLGVSTRIERRLSIEDDGQSLQNDLEPSPEIRPGDSWSQSTNSIPKQDSDSSKEPQHVVPEMCSEPSSPPPLSNSDQALDPTMDLSESYLLPEMQSITDAPRTQTEVIPDDQHLISQIEDAFIPRKDSGSSKESSTEETRDPQTEPIREGISISHTILHPPNRLTSSHLALIGTISCSASAIIYAWMMSNEGEVPDEFEQPDLAETISDTDSREMDTSNHGVDLKAQSDVEDSGLVDQHEEIIETERESVGRELKSDAFQDQPLLSIAQDTVQESSSVSVDSKMESLQIEDPITTPIHEIDMTETIQSGLLEPILGEKDLDPPSPSSSSSLFLSFTSPFSCFAYLIFIFLLWRFKSSLFSKVRIFRRNHQHSSEKLIKSEMNEDGEKPRIRLTDSQEDQIEMNVTKIFGILDGIYIPQDSFTVVTILKTILSNSWIVRPFYVELIKRLGTRSDEEDHQTDRMIMMKLIQLMKMKDLIKEDRKGKKKNHEKKEDEEGLEDAKVFNHEESLLWEAIKEIEEEEMEMEMETKPEIKRKESVRKSKRKSMTKTPEIKVEEVEEQRIEEDFISEAETVLPSTTKPKTTKKPRSNQRISTGKKQEEIEENKVLFDDHSTRRRSSNRIKTTELQNEEEQVKIEQPTKKNTSSVNKKLVRKSQLGIKKDSTGTSTVAADQPVVVRSSPRNKKS